ncbi:MAG: hypothetical protein MJZ82_04860 [Paludibacteraceae bacterium]|nr:hypothetical protein [Paludibacteraceae bacterium]
MFYITHFSPDTSLRYNLPIVCNAITGRVEKVHIPGPREEAMRCAAINDTGNIEKMLKQVNFFREAVGSKHIYYFRGARVMGDKMSKYDFQIAFNYKRQYYLLTHFVDDISAEEVRVTERWGIRKIEPPPHR